MRCLVILAFSLLIGCGGSGSSPTSSPPPTTPPPDPSGPTVTNRSFTLERLTIDSGPSPFVLQSPEATGALNMQASGRYTLSFRVSVGNLVWAQTIGGTHTFVGNTLRMTPDDSLKNAPVPFQQTVIVENTDVSWTSDTRVTINLPIRPGGFRAEDRLELAYVQGTTVASGLTQPQTQQQLASLLQILRNQKK